MRLGITCALTLMTMAFTVNAEDKNESEKKYFDNWLVITRDAGEFMPANATALGFDRNENQKLQYYCATRKDGFRVEYIKVKAGTDGYMKNIKYSSDKADSFGSFFVSKDAPDSYGWASISNLAFIDDLLKVSMLRIEMENYEFNGTSTDLISTERSVIDVYPLNDVIKYAREHCNQ